MKPTDLLEAARRLVEPRNLTDGLWGRAATFLARQALEQRLADILAVRGQEARTRLSTRACSCSGKCSATESSRRQPGIRGLR